MSGSLLSTHGLSAGYGDFQALFGIDVSIDPGEAVALIGANGAGKSTLLKCLTGLLAPTSGTVQLDGESVGGLQPHRLVERGVAMVPEGRRLFAGLTVEENLRVARDHGRRSAVLGPDWTIPRVQELFPVLREKRHALVESLSGGQQQMVAIARALLCNPRLLLCDELSLGLAPRVIAEIYEALPTIAAQGMALVLVEQDVALAQRSTQHVYCLLEGRVTLSAPSAQVSREDITRAFFGADHAVA
ncbi:MAG: ABC transporter ATP-binding protein [Burkholderiales bacterium]|nr:MAG: ABC transporter ATP-binding protein [Burkholderiales bacterium]